MGSEKEGERGREEGERAAGRPDPLGGRLDLKEHRVRDAATPRKVREAAPPSKFGVCDGQRPREHYDNTFHRVYSNRFNPQLKNGLTTFDYMHSRAGPNTLEKSLEDVWTEEEDFGQFRARLETMRITQEKQLHVSTWA